MLVITLVSLISAVSAYTEVSSKKFMYKNIDPIVFPGSFNRSHLHIFFGSDAITATTTTSASLREGCTTAENPNDLSTYWTPTLLYTGAASPSPLVPESFEVYYENIQDAEIAFPEDFRAVSGNAKATNEATVVPSARISWFCENAPAEAKDSAAFPTQTCPTHLQHLVYFQDCVNPTTLAYTYSGTQNWNSTSKSVNRCPEGMKRIPRARFSIRYDVRGVIKGGWSGEPPLTLSSGNSYSAHGDFFNGWDKTAATNMLAAPGNTFVAINGARGNGESGQPKCQATDADPSHGTSDYETSVALKSGKNTTSTAKRALSWSG